MPSDDAFVVRIWNWIFALIFRLLILWILSLMIITWIVIALTPSWCGDDGMTDACFASLIGYSFIPAILIVVISALFLPSCCK